MIGAGHPIHSFKAAERRTPAETFARSEYGDRETRWLMRDARALSATKPSRTNGKKRFVSIRAAVARLAAMLF